MIYVDIVGMVSLFIKNVIYVQKKNNSFVILVGIILMNKFIQHV